MTLPTLATVTELASWLGVPIDPESERAWLILESASGLVRSAAGQTWVDASGNLTDVAPDARTITLTAAARAWANPTGAVDKTTGPFRNGWASGETGVLLTEGERATLARLAARGFGGLFTISTTRGDFETRTMVDVQGGHSIEVDLPDHGPGPFG